MLTFDQLLQSYNCGELTRGEFFAHTISILSSVQPETMAQRLRERAGDLDAFQDWVDDVASGAEIFLGGRSVRISNDARAAIERFRARMRGTRYTRLASSMDHWATEAPDREPGLAVTDIEPFQSQEIEPFLLEVA